MQTNLYTIAILSAAAFTVVLAQGPLTPPGAPAPVMKTLEQIEPRKPVSSVPFTISQPGSYYLTGNLQFTATSGDAIIITANNVTLDLMGFTISSVNGVTGAAISIGEELKNIAVMNGIIAGNTTVTVSVAAGNRSWSVTELGFAYGIQTKFYDATDCHFSHLRISGCRREGLHGGRRAVIDHVTASQNGDYGIYAIDGSVVHCTTNENGGDGIALPNEGVVAHCMANDNSDRGVTGSTLTVSNTTATRNGGIGLYASGGSVANCTSSFNGSNGISSTTVTNSRAANNGDNGISASSITNCVCFSNDGHGIFTTSGSVTNCTAQENGKTGITCTGSLINCNAWMNGDHGISVGAGAVAFCRASANNANNSGSTNLDAPTATTTRTGNYPAP